MQHQYNPIGQRECTTTPEQMAEKLQRRIKEVEERRGQTDERCNQSTPQLVWAPKAEGAHHIEESTGRYRVSGAKVQGQLRYSAWRRSVVPGSMPEPLGCFDSLDDAKAACASHAAAAAK